MTLNPLKSKTAYGLEHGDRVTYDGDGSSVPRGMHGSVRTLYDDEMVEVAFDDGTLLITNRSSLSRASGWAGMGMYA